MVGALGLAGTMSLNVLERTREIGVMRAIGARNGSIRGIVMSESMLIGVLSWAIATPLSFAMSAGFATLLGIAIFERPIPFSFDPRGVGIWLGIAIVISTFASLLPARRAARISVREALAYE